MFESVINYGKELEKATESTKVFLYRFRGARRRLVNKIAKADAEIKTAKNVDKYVASLKPELVKAAIKDGKDILSGNAIGALRDNYEFDSPTYTKALFEAIKDSDTYKIIFTGKGWKSNPVVYIDLNRTAGRLQSWGRAIIQARKELGVKVPRKGSKLREKSARQASLAWARIFERRGDKPEFRRTIKLRLTLSGQLAPFWQLLDKGVVPMASDRGGFPTPKAEVTNFVHDTETSLTNRLKNAMATKEREYYALFDQYAISRRDAIERLAQMDALIDKIALDLKIVRRLEYDLGLIEKAIDGTKLERAVQLIKEGLLKTGRISLTPSGSKKRASISVQKIVDYLSEDY